MVWSISISADGWAGLRAALEAWTHKALIDALADDTFERVEQASGSTEHATRAATALRKRYANASQDALTQQAYETLERNDTCDNGGFEYWIDREGHHKVSPFDHCDAGLISECLGFYDPDDIENTEGAETPESEDDDEV